MKTLLLWSLFLCATSPALAWTNSVYNTRLEDAKAIYLAPRSSGVAGDGLTDDSAVIQAAMDKAESSAHEGIVFLASGRYRLTRTVYVWPGIRVIGYGATRPVFVLAQNTPGFQTGVGVMVMFTGAGASDKVRMPGACAVSAAWNRSSQRSDRRRHAQHFLFGDEQYRL